VSDYPALLRVLVGGNDLNAEQMAFAIGAMMDGDWTPVQAGGFLAALATKGETPAELVGAAEAMRARSLHVEHDLPLVVDTCGTGGDGAHTINVSTLVGFIVAACGAPVAKHGNRSASSRCGSADVLEAAGVAIEASPEASRARLEREGFAFLYAQQYHPTLRAVAPVRRDLRIRTIFNLLGPLANPARATHQIVGVADPAHLELIGGALVGLGSTAGAVVHAKNGIDEIAGDAPSEIFQFDGSSARRWLLDPNDFGVRVPLEALAGGDPESNAASLRSLLEGERSPRSDVVALNAALALIVARRAGSMREGLSLARTSLSDGSALEVFESLRRPAELEFA
jgi:anthranilate phosphoribosyltransferase